MSQASVFRLDLIGVGAATALPIVAIAGLMSSPGHTSERLQRQSQQVRLLVPLETGHELDQLLTTVPAAQLVRIEGREYVQLATFADARVAYRLGRTMQKRTKLPFALAYDEAHPQRDGHWLAQERNTPPSTEIIRQGSLRQMMPASTAMALPMAEASAASANGNRAARLGGALQLRMAATAPTALESLAGRGHQPDTPAVEVPQPQSIAMRSQLSAAPRQSDSRWRHTALLSGGRGSQPARQRLAHDPTIQPDTTTWSGIRPVAITAVPLVRPQLLAINTGLNYLFVRLQSPEQLAALRRHAVVVEMGERNGELLARVGVFTPTRVGRRLLNQQASRLAAMGYDLEVTYVNT